MKKMFYELVILILGMYLGQFENSPNISLVAHRVLDFMKSSEDHAESGFFTLLDWMKRERN